MLEIDAENALLLDLLDFLEAFNIIDNGILLRLFTMARSWGVLLHHCELDQ